MAGLSALRNWREARKITQVALGKELGVTSMTIWRWEHGQRAPSKRVIPKITALTGIPAGELLETGSAQ